jgi:integrase
LGEFSVLFAEDGSAAKRARARALILLLLYSGMRISDAAFIERASIGANNILDYMVIKTRKRIGLPIELNQTAVDALKALPPSRVYFFQPDRDDDYREARHALRERVAVSS